MLFCSLISILNSPSNSCYLKPIFTSQAEQNTDKSKRKMTENKLVCAECKGCYI